MALVDVIVCGATGASTGTLAPVVAELPALAEPPAAAVDPVLRPPDVPNETRVDGGATLAAGSGCPPIGIAGSAASATAPAGLPTNAPDAPVAAAPAVPA